MPTIHDLAAVLRAGDPLRTPLYDEVFLDPGISWALDDLAERTGMWVEHPVQVDYPDIDECPAADPRGTPHWVPSRPAEPPVRRRIRFLSLHYTSGKRLNLGREWVGTSEYFLPDVPDASSVTWIGYAWARPFPSPEHSVAFSAIELAQTFRRPIPRLVLVQNARHRFVACRTPRTPHRLHKAVEKLCEEYTRQECEVLDGGDWGKYAALAREHSISLCDLMQITLYEGYREETTPNTLAQWYPLRRVVE